MKRVFGSIVASGLLCIGLAGCGATAKVSSSGGSSSDPASAATVKTDDSSSIADSSSTAKQAETIELNKTITTDDYELTLTGVEWTNEVKEQISENMSWSINAESMGGETMLLVRGTFKNLGGSNYSTSAMNVGFKVNDKYDLQGSAMTHNSSISPLSTENVFFYTATSNEMKDTFKNGTMTLKLKSCTTEGDSIQIGTDVIGEYVLKIAV